MLCSSTSKSMIPLTRIGRLLQTSTQSITTSTSHNIKVNHEGVKNNAHLQRFEMSVENEVAYIAYKKSNHVYDLVYIKVPKAFAGKGVGQQLAKRTFDHIVSENGKMILSCKYLQNFYNKNIKQYEAHIHK